MSITNLSAYVPGKGLGTSQDVKVAGVSASVAESRSSGMAHPQEQVMRKAELEAAVKKLNEQVAPVVQSIEFSMDQETDRIIVKVVDTATQKVLRQIPNEEVLAFSRNLDKLQGLVVRQTA